MCLGIMPGGIAAVCAHSEAGLWAEPSLCSACREPVGLPTTMSSGMTIASLRMSYRSSPTSCVTPTCAARALCPSQHPLTMLTWWPSGPGTTWWTKNTIGERVRGFSEWGTAPPSPPANLAPPDHGCAHINGDLCLCFCLQC